MKRLTLIVIACLLVSFSIAPAQWWGWNKDLYNWSTQEAYDLAVIMDGRSPVDWHFDGYTTGHYFNNFAAYPVGPYMCLHWTNPNGPIPVGDMVHIGASGSTGNLEIIDMYWTNQWGVRIPRSVVWNATARVRYESGFPVICLVNRIDLGDIILDEEEWRTPRPIQIGNFSFIVQDTRVELEDLNAANETLNADMQVLLPEVVVGTGEELAITLPVQATAGQYIIIRWENMAEGVGGSDATQARDWAEFEVVGADQLGMEDQGTPESSKLLSVTSFPGYSDINYTLAKATNVSVSIYSVNGEKIASLVSEFTTPGEHTVRWNTTDVPSGVYICRVSADGVHATSKCKIIPGSRSKRGSFAEEPLFHAPLPPPEDPAERKKNRL